MSKERRPWFFAFLAAVAVLLAVGIPYLAFAPDSKSAGRLAPCKRGFSITPSLGTPADPRDYAFQAEYWNCSSFTREVELQEWVLRDKVRSKIRTLKIKLFPWKSYQWPYLVPAGTTVGVTRLYFGSRAVYYVNKKRMVANGLLINMFTHPSQ